MNSAVFRQYDIRGNSITDITPELAYKIGFYFAVLHTTKGNNNICIARDGRHSSQALYSSLLQGISDAGAQGLAIGLVPTPLLYFADINIKPAASIMITGSHNDKDDNGFKLIAGNKAFFGSQIQDLYHYIKLSCISGQAKQNKVIGPNSCNLNLTDQYINVITKNLVFNQCLKIAWDPGNGATCLILKKLINQIPGNHIIINGEINGDFPARSPEPTIAENLHKLIDIVKKEHCDFGIAFDGDGDRISVIRGNGDLISTDQLLCLFAEDILKSNPDRAIILDIKISQVTFEQIKKYTGRPIICRTGHVFIKDKMQDYNGIFGAEVSGHLFFADHYYGYDDGIYAALRLIDLLSRKIIDNPMNTVELTLDQLLKALPISYNTPEIRIPITAEKKFAAIEKIKQYLTANQIQFNDIDGVRVNNDHGWWLVRASNTEDKLTLRCEGTSNRNFELIKSDLNCILGILLLPTF